MAKRRKNEIQQTEYEYNDISQDFIRNLANIRAAVDNRNYEDIPVLGNTNVVQNTTYSDRQTLADAAASSYTQPVDTKGFMSSLDPLQDKIQRLRDGDIAKAGYAASRSLLPLTDNEGFASWYQAKTLSPLTDNEGFASRYSNTDLIDGWLQDGYKLSKDELKQAKDIIAKYDFTAKNPNVYDLTDAEKAELEKMNALRAKVYKTQAFGEGLLSAVPGYDALMKLIDREGYDTQVANQMTQNPFSYMGGKIGGGLALNAAGQGMLGATSYGAKLADAVGKVVKNPLAAQVVTDALEDAPVDLALDTIPELVSNIASGKSGREIAGDLAKNIGLNAGMNTGAALLGNAGDIAKAIKDKQAGMVAEEVDYAKRLLSGVLDSGTDEADQIIPQLLENPVSSVPKSVLEEQAALNRGNLEPLNSIAQERDLQRASNTLFPTDDSITIPRLMEPAERKINLRDTEGALNTGPEPAVTALSNGDLFSTSPNMVNADSDLPLPATSATSTGVSNLHDADSSALTSGSFPGVSAEGNGDSFTDSIPRLRENASVDKKSLQHMDRVDRALADGSAYKTHTPDEIKKMMEYTGSTDQGIVEYANMVKNSKPGEYIKPYELGKVSDRAAEDIKRITGIDNVGNDLILPKDSVIHIENRHGLHGKSDSSMADPNSLGRINFILENYDEAFLGRQSRGQRLSNGEYAPAVVFTKKIDGHYFLVEGITDAKTKKNIITSAYIGNEHAIEDGIKDGSIVRVANMTGDQSALLRTSKTGRGSTSTNSIPYLRENTTPNMPENAANEIPVLKEATEAPVQEIPKLDDISSEVKGDKKNISKVRTNTIENDSISDAVTKGQMDKNLYEYTVNEEKASLEQAADNLKHMDQCEAKYLGDMSGVKNANGVDADTMMGMYQQYCNQKREALKAGDEALANSLQSKINQITKNIQTQATAGGQFNQALAKYTRTADGSIMAAEVRARQAIEEMAKNNPRLSKKVTTMAEEFKRESESLWDELVIPLSDSADAGKLSDDVISEKVDAVIDEAISHAANKKIKKNIAKNSDYLKDAMTKSIAEKQYGDFQNVLDDFEQLSVTGFTGIDDSTRKQVEDLFDQMDNYGLNSKKRVQLENEAYSILANAVDLHGSFGEKIDTYRYFCMLHGITTHIKNLVGNDLVNQMSDIKDELAALMEASVSGTKKLFTGEGIQRTKSFLPANRALRKASKADADEVYRMLVDGNKYYSVGSGIDANKEIFKSKVLNFFPNLNSDLLNKEDEFALYRKYKHSLSRYLKANGANESIFKSKKKTDIELLEKARAYAIDEAKKDTFHNSSLVADVLSSASHRLRTSDSLADKSVGTLLEGTFPFKKTPVNVMKTIAAYSPLELGKVLTDMPKLVKGTMNASEFIDDIAKGVTGTGLLIGGYTLAKAGILNGSDDSNGKQKFSITVGNGSYTVNNFEPASTPLVIGAELYGMTNDPDDSGSAFENFVNALTTIGEPIVETTMLKGVGELLNSGTQGSDGEATPLLNAGTTMASNYVGQFLPAEAGKIARSVDDTRRSTYTGEKGIKNIIGRQVKSAQNKIPFLSEKNNPYIDVWGQEQKNVGGNLAGRLAYQHLSPGYYQETDNSDRMVELRRLKEATGDKDILNTGVSSSPYVDGARRKLTPDELETYARAAGNKKGELIDYFMSLPEYKSLSDESKVAVANSLYGLGDKIGLQETFPDEYSSKDKIFKTYNSDGMEAAVDLAIQKNQLDQYDLSLTDSNIEQLKSSTPEEMQAFVDKQTTFEELNIPKNETTEDWYEKGMLKELQTYSDKHNYLTKELGMKASDSTYKELMKRRTLDDVKKKVADMGLTPERVTKLQENEKFEKQVKKDKKEVLKKYGLETSDAAMSIYNEKNNEALLKEYAKINNKQKVTQMIPVLEGTNLSDRDRGYLLSKKIHTYAKKAQEFYDKGDYENLYLYYMIKNDIDTDHNGTLKKSEKSLLDAYLKQKGYSQADIAEIKGWY